MPIYEFHCEKCGRESEILVRSKDWKGTACPYCGSKKLSKNFSAFATVAGSVGDLPPCKSGGGCCGGQCSHRH